MARPNPAAFGEKYRRVQVAVAAALSADRHHFDFTGEVEPGVRLVLSEAGSTALAFSLWSYPQDIAELCSDASVPATAALLAIDAEQAREARAAGVSVDLSQFSRSQSRPEVYYALFDRASPRRIHTVLHRLVPDLEPHAVAA
jgi:NAD(P)H-dependent flavin oxidoreductase YrpB (nitropropane dioxygenase family)